VECRALPSNAGVSPAPLQKADTISPCHAELLAEIEVQGPARGSFTETNPAKQELLLELCHCFHPYLMKYLVMI
jgi:hypothetical protein